MNSDGLQFTISLVILALIVAFVIASSLWGEGVPLRLLAIYYWEAVKDAWRRQWER